ncbi:hypothetical protein F6U93_06785 [Tamlana haliotis]|uniref:Lipoprotein n=1 Tax=Pseudotamlana haliotis TaxID=2614804 RepID=A0A6N6MCP6_9FLAO|nr:hypothetical protein [Tamlana haliotis]KAB1068401.1 hypothetical protein F6U93_06785 [Tamlana haliotis]
MKKVIFILVMVVALGLISCKETLSNKSEDTTCYNKKDTVSDMLKNTISPKEKGIQLMGDSLISDGNFIDKINTTCVSGGDLEISDSYKMKCEFFKIKFIYENLNGINNEVIQNFKNINYSIKQSKETSDADDFVIKNLILKKEGVLTDSIRMYSYENYIEALAQKNEYFYIKDNNLWILKFNIDEDGVNVVDWHRFTVNDGGKIILEEN